MATQPTTVARLPAAPGLPSPVVRRLPSGEAELDELLGGGWPGEGLTEIAGRGRTSLGLAAVRAAQRAGLPVAWVDGTHTFCPATARVDLARLVLVQPTAEDHEPDAPGTWRGGAAGEPGGREPRGREARGREAWGTRSRPTARALYAADTLLRSRAFGLLVLDMPSGTTTPAVWFRLARLAAGAQTGLLMLQGGARPQSGSAAALVLGVRLAVGPEPRWGEPAPPGVDVVVLRDRARPGRRRLVLAPSG